MGTSVGPALAYLLAQLPPVIAGVDSTAQVVDAYPVDRSTQKLVVIGRSGPENQTVSSIGMDQRIVLGSTRTNEQYEIPCYIQTFTGGTDQSAPRNDAIALFDAFMGWLVQNPTLGGALSEWAEVGRVQIDSTPEENTVNGRFTVITFSITCRHYYFP